MTQLNEKDHNAQMEDMKSFDEQMPCVGIFWYDPNDNTLFGVRKKELTPQMVEELERGMQNYREVIKRQFGKDPDQIPGAGAAGGLGALLLIVLGGEMKSGIETVLALNDFDKRLQGAKLVITGEGRTDWQSACGKVLQGVGERAKKAGVPVIALSGSLGPGYEKVYEHGISSVMTTVDGPMALEDAMGRAKELYYQAALRMFRLIQAGASIKTI